MNRYICIHGHFYQPPRENPWLEEVELQDSAYPYHDWNQRITAECYSPNAASRILDSQKKINDIVNNYSKINFNFGPTLLSWMEKNSPDTYQNILDADKVSQEKFSGHGSAIAQSYNHMIMPLANLHDKHTQVVWGIKDFEYRFQRKPEGMWLSETAVDIETLEVLSEHGIKFTILAPSQAARTRKIGEKKWKNVRGDKVDPKRAYMCNLPSGKTITIFFYDGPVSQEIAFRDLLKNGEGFANRLLGLFNTHKQDPQIVNIATDGETYGHHHRYGEMALSYCLHHIEAEQLANITVYGDYLEKFAPQYEVKIFENTSWSCAHGVERWRSDCGCCIGSHQKWDQKWRLPLREALDWVRDSIIPAFEGEMSKFVADPWTIRNNYIDVILNRSSENVNKFFKENINNGLSEGDQTKVIKLLEMQRHLMLMYTSCGWFFDEISGIETTQIMLYASRAMQLAKELFGMDLEPDFLEKLKSAPSNVLELENGANVYEKYVRPSIVDFIRVGVHYAVSSLFEEYSKTTQIYSYIAKSQAYDKWETGKQRLAIGKAQIKSDLTLDEHTVSFAVLHMGDHNLVAGVREFSDDKSFARMQQEIRDSFRRNDVPATIKLIERNFDGHYSLWHLFKDEQSKILYQVLDSTLVEIESSLRKINEYHYPIIQVIKQLRIPLPKVLANTVLVMVNKDLLEVLGSDDTDFKRLEELVHEVSEWSLEIDKITIEFVVKSKVNSIMDEFQRSPNDTDRIEQLAVLLRVLKPLELNLDLWNAQNIYFSIGKKLYDEMANRVSAGDEKAGVWMGHFDHLGEYLRVVVG